MSRYQYKTCNKNIVAQIHTCYSLKLYVDVQCTSHFGISSAISSASVMRKSQQKQEYCCINSPVILENELTNKFHKMTWKIKEVFLSGNETTINFCWKYSKFSHQWKWSRWYFFIFFPCVKNAVCGSSHLFYSTVLVYEIPYIFMQSEYRKRKIYYVKD